MIQVRIIHPQQVHLYNPEGKCIGLVNEFEFNDVRIQIAEQKLEGYYVVHNDTLYRITQYGTIANWGTGLFDMIENQLSTLFKIQLKTIKKDSKPKEIETTI